MASPVRRVAALAICCLCLTSVTTAGAQPVAAPDPGAVPKYVADPIALGLLKGEYHEGDLVSVDATSDGTLTFSAKSTVST